MGKQQKSSSGISPEFRAAMDRAGEGALEVIRRHGAVRSREEPPKFVPAYKKGAGRAKLAPVNPEIVAYAQGEGSTLKTTALIRAVASTFPAASVAEIRASLPDLNPSTVGIQVGKARRA